MAEEPLLRRGSSGDAVKRLQTLLRDAGFDPRRVDGKFGANTEAAVRAFQLVRGLVVDGIAGPATWGALSVPATDTTLPMTDNATLEVEVLDVPLPDGAAGEVLKTFLSGINSAETSPELFDEAVTAVKAAADAVVPALSQLADSWDEVPSEVRWSLVYTARLLQDPRLLPFFTHVVNQPLPSLEGRDPHRGLAIMDATTRADAIEGIGQLAAENEEAVQTLLSLVREDSAGIRRAAVTALITAGVTSEVTDQIGELLPDEERFLLTLDRPEVQDVAQVEEPTEHLREGGSQRSWEPPPDVMDGA